MTPLALLDRLADELRCSTQQLVVRAGVVLAILAFVLTVGVAGDGLPLWGTALLLVLAAGSAYRPDSHAPLALLGASAWAWGGSLPGAVTGWTLLAAVELVAVHVACTLAALGPPQLVLDRAVLRRWGVRAGVLAAGAALVWLVVRATALLDPGTSAAATVAALAALLGWTSLLTRRTVPHDPA